MRWLLRQTPEPATEVSALQPDSRRCRGCNKRSPLLPTTRHLSSATLEKRKTTTMNRLLPEYSINLCIARDDFPSRNDCGPVDSGRSAVSLIRCPLNALPLNIGLRPETGQHLLWFLIIRRCKSEGHLEYRLYKLSIFPSMHLKEPCADVIVSAAALRSILVGDDGAPPVQKSRRRGVGGEVL